MGGTMRRSKPLKGPGSLSREILPGTGVQAVNGTTKYGWFGSKHCDAAGKFIDGLDLPAGEKILNFPQQALAVFSVSEAEMLRGVIGHDLGIRLKIVQVLGGKMLIEFLGVD